MSGVKGRSGGPRRNAGGVRPGSGRPTNRERERRELDAATDAHGIPWGDIARYADSGVSERTILEACGLTEETLRGFDVLDRFRKVLARGHARCRANLQLEIKTRSEKASKGAGSVNALALRARNLLDWDRQQASEEPEPDLASAKERLRETLRKLAVNQSDALGRDVSIDEVVFHEATGRYPERPGEVH